MRCRQVVDVMDVWTVCIHCTDIDLGLNPVTLLSDGSCGDSGAVFAHIMYLYSAASGTSSYVMVLTQ